MREFPPLTENDVDMFCDFFIGIENDNRRLAAMKAVANLKRWTGRIGPSHKVWSK